MEESISGAPSDSPQYKPSTKKKWWKYFFEFLMLFLAVTLGFFVDNLREEMADRNLESQHIQSLLSDLKQDTSLFQRQIREHKQVIDMCDSVMLLLKKEERTQHDLQRLYFLSRRMMPQIKTFFLNDRAYEEMTSSGVLRLVHHKNIADSISKYYFSSRKLSWLNNAVISRSERKTTVESRVLSAFTTDEIVNKETMVFSPPNGHVQLITKDKDLINQFALSIHYIASLCIYKRNSLARLKVHASRLLVTLHKEYPDLK